MTEKEKLIKLIDAVYEWAGRPTKDGAKKLRDLASSMDPRKYRTQESVQIVDPRPLSYEDIVKAAENIRKKTGRL